MNLKVIYLLLILAAILSFFGCRSIFSSQVGGPCTYMSFSEKVTVVGIHTLNSQLNEVKFETMDEIPKTYTFKGSNLRYLDEEVTKSIMSGKSIFMLYGQEITKGTCTPLMWSKVSLVDE